MAELTWRYCKQLEGINILGGFVEEGFIFPASYRTCAEKNNGGRPDKKEIDAGDQQLSFRRLLRIDSEGTENIREVYESLRDLNLNIIPFGDDSFGNYFCFVWPDGAREPEVCFLDHETERLTPVASSFEQFLDMLY
jgi:hypothetical protein